MPCMQIWSRADAIAAIRRDYSSNYFVSGRGEKNAILPPAQPPTAYQMSCLYMLMLMCALLDAGDMAAYEDDCLFADPFAGFNGVERFQKNVSNLGGLM